MRYVEHTASFLAALAALGCGENFPPPSQVSGVRVLAVRPTPASGAPGATVHLSMLLADSREVDPNYAGVDRPLNVLWFAGCHNPPGRQYFACLPGLRALAQGLSDASAPLPPEAAGLVGAGLEFDVTLPDDVLSAAPVVEHDPVHYGVSYVFFVACAGTPAYDPTVQEGLPVTCSAEGKKIGASGLVVGFTTIYTYEGSQNEAPVMTSLDFDGEAMPASFATAPATPCVSDDECAGDYRHRRVCTADTRTCAPVIGACTGETCPPLKVTPHLDTASVEQFTGGNEIMWASFYASSGAVSAPTRLLVDRNTGITSDFSEEWRMPGSPRTSRIWVTINDQRGGADWGFFDVSVQ